MARVAFPPMNPFERFHPAVAAWFTGRFGTPTPAQAEAWPARAAHALVRLRTVEAAPI